MKPLKNLKNKLKEINKGRTYIYCCGSKEGTTCIESKDKLQICYECHVNECQKWYELGRQDMLLKVMQAQKKRVK